MYIRAVIMSFVASAASASAPPCDNDPSHETAPLAARGGERDEGGHAELIDVIASGETRIVLLQGGAAPADLPQVRVLRRDGSCVWQPTADAPGLPSEPLSDPDEVHVSVPPSVSNEASASRGIRAEFATMQDFERTAGAEGLAMALHVYGLDRGFRLVIDRTMAADDAGEASQYLKSHPAPGAWQETQRMRSSDDTLAYVQGVITDAQHRTTRHYVEIWQYDARVANLGLRLLWLGMVMPLPP